MATPSYYDSTPSDLVVELELTAGTYTDMSDTALRETIAIHRAKPGSPGTLNMMMGIAAGGVNIHEEQYIRIYDASNPALAYPRYFWGPIKELVYDVEGANEETFNITANGPDQLLKEPPYQLTTTYTVGYAPWTTHTTYIIGDNVTPTPINGFRYVCSRGGVSYNAQPLWDNSPGSTTTEMPDKWTLTTDYAVGDIVMATTSNGHKFICDVAGTSFSTQPSWNLTTGGITLESTGLQWHEYGSDSDGVQWHQSSSSYVTDQFVLNDLLPLFFGTTVQYGGINNLIASVPYMQFPPGMKVEDCLAEIAKYAASSTYNISYPSWLHDGVYNLGTLAEPTTVNNHYYTIVAVTGDQKAGAAGHEPTWPLTPGGTVVDNHVTWKEAGLIGRYIASFTYQAGQIVDPSNGYYYTSLNAGTSGAGAVTWPTTLGTSVTTGTVTFVCSGATSVLPGWQLSIPPDNVGHTASWTPVFNWYDLNSTTQVPTLTTGYSDAIVFDGSVIHWDTLQLTRSNTETANRVYMFGDNGSAAMADGVSQQNNENGHIRSIPYTNTDLKTNGECQAAAANALARLRPRETAHGVTKQLPDPIAMRGLRKVKFTHALFGLSSTVYPLTDITLAMPDGIAEYTIEAGDSFLDQTDDVLQSTLGGRLYTRDLIAPAKVTFPTDWVLQNTSDPQGSGSTLVLKWHSGGEADLKYFQLQYKLSTDIYRRWGPRIDAPTSNVTLSGLPGGVGFQLFVLAKDTSDNPRNPVDADYAASLPITIARFVGNLPPNGSFEFGDQNDPTLPASWVRIASTGGTAIRTNSDASEGAYSAKLSTSGIAFNKGGLRSDYFYVRSIITKYNSLTFKAKASVAATVLNYVITYYDNNFSLVTSTSGTKSLTTSWAAYPTIVVNQANVAYAKLELSNTSAAARDIFVDAIGWFEQINTSMMEVGSVDSTILAPGAVTVDKLNLQPLVATPIVYKDDLGNPIVQVYWSPGAQQLVFLSLVDGSTYTQTGLSFLAANGSLVLQNGTLTLSGSTSADGNLVVSGTTTQGSGSTPIKAHLSTTASLNFGSTLAASASDLTVTLTGAALGDIVGLGVPNASVLADSCYTAWVSATNTITVRFLNNSSFALDPAVGTFRVSVTQY